MLDFCLRQMGQDREEQKGILSQWLGLLSHDGSAIETHGNRIKLYFEGDEEFFGNA